MYPLVIYTRYSSEMQRSDSCTDQERNIRAALDRLGVDHRDALVLRDEAESGTKLSRDGFVELFKTHPASATTMGQIIALRMNERRESLEAASLRGNARSHTGWLLDKIAAVFNLAPDR